MKRLVFVLPVVLSALAPMAQAITVDVDNLTPVLTFPEPQPQTVSKNATSINR